MPSLFGRRGQEAPHAPRATHCLCQMRLQQHRAEILAPQSRRRRRTEHPLPAVGTCVPAARCRRGDARPGASAGWSAATAAMLPLSTSTSKRLGAHASGRMRDVRRCRRRGRQPPSREGSPPPTTPLPWQALTSGTASPASSCSPLAAGWRCSSPRPGRQPDSRAQPQGSRPAPRRTQSAPQAASGPGQEARQQLPAPSGPPRLGCLLRRTVATG